MFLREALVSWFVDHKNIQEILGVDLESFGPSNALSIISPWQSNGNLLDCLWRFEELGLSILLDVLVCSV